MYKVTSLATRLSLGISGSGQISNLRFSSLRFLLCCFWLFAGLLLAGSPIQAEINAGDILVADVAGGTNGRGALFVVNPTTGQRTVLSDFGNPAQGPLGGTFFEIVGTLTGVAVGADGRIFVTDLFAGEGRFGGGALFEVDPDTGNRTVLSDFHQGDIHGHLYYGLAVDAKGRVIANLQTLDPPLNELDQAVVRVDPDTDERTIVTDLTNPRQGGPGEAFIGDLALERSEKILISTEIFGVGSPSVAIFRVQPETGKRKLVSDFTNAEQGVLAGPSGGMAVETSRQILVNANGLTEGPYLILRIDPKTGQRTVLSNCNDSAQGTLCQVPAGLAVESSGDIVVSANKNPDTTETKSLFRVSSSTGQHTLLSDSDNPVQGPSLRLVTYIAIVPQDSDAKGHKDRRSQMR